MLESVDARNKLEDLSGVVFEPGENPYNAIIKACHDSPNEIQTLYETHRTVRNSQQKAKYLAEDFKELIIDPILLRLEDPSLEPGFKDHRNCLVFWARPPEHIIKLAHHVQTLLQKSAPGLWLMPTHRMHMTAMEVTHSRTPEEIDALVSTMKPHVPGLTSFTFGHRSRVVKPMVSYDLAAIALSFVPAAGEPVVSSSSSPGEEGLDDAYTYHHLRRDVFDKIRADTGVQIDSRYVVPSAHITLGRFLTQRDHGTPEARQAWVRAIDEVNGWLEAEVWGKGGVEDGNDVAGQQEFLGEWIVGQERGLDCRAGRLWYGGGRTVLLGEGFF